MPPLSAGWRAILHGGAVPARGVLELLILPLGLAVAAGSAVASLVEPAWEVGGLAYVSGHAKNREAAAVTAGLLAGALSPLLGGRRVTALARAALAALGWWLIGTHYQGPSLAAWIPQAALLCGVAGALAWLWPADRGVAGALEESPRSPPASGGSRVTTAVSLGMAVALAGSVGLAPRPIDTFHDGEVLASALDLVNGGRPFETLIWPHGLHDTGVAAFWVAVLDELGSSPVVLARATTGALGAGAIYLLCRSTLGTGVAALASLSLVAGTLASRQVSQLEHFGIALFVVVAHWLLGKRSPRALLAAGAALGLGHLYRIEVGVYATAAALAVLAWRHLSSEGSAGARLRGLLLEGALIAAGAAAVLLGMRAVVGWPGGDWFDFVFRVMPRFHRDATGLPFPFPIAGLPMPLRAEPTTGVARLLLPLVLMAAAVERAIPRLRRRFPGEPARRLETLVFFACFAAISTRSALGRSDAGHVAQWVAIPLWATLLLLLGVASSRWGWPRLGIAGVVAFSALCVRPAQLALGPPSLVTSPLDALLAAPGLARAHWEPNPPAGECGDRFISRPELELAANRALARDTCELERALAAHGVRRLLIEHSAPWYQVRLNLRFPSRFYAARRAFTLEQQREHVTGLRAYDADALLRIRGYGAVDRYDVYGGLGTPLVAAYVRVRQHGAPVVETPLGDLVLWTREAAASRPGEPGGTGLVLHVDEAVLQPDTGLIVARGWAADDGNRQPLRLEAERGELRAGIGRPDVAEALGGAWAARSGWWWAFRIVPGEPIPALLLRRADGTVAARTIDVGSARRLPSLPIWHGIEGSLRRVEAEARADRAAAREPGS